MRDRLLFLQQKAVEAAMLPDDSPDKVLMGLWLHGELAKMDDEGVPDDLRVDFNATVKIMLDEVLPLPETGPGGLWLP